MADDDCHGLQYEKENSIEGKDLFRKSIICYQIYPTIYSQLEVASSSSSLIRNTNYYSGFCQYIILTCDFAFKTSPCRPVFARLPAPKIALRPGFYTL
jgi:hypothetical protein